MQRKPSDPAAVPAVLLSVLLLLLFLLLPQKASRGLLLLSACAALPEGGAAELRALVTQTTIQTPLPQTVPAQASPALSDDLTDTPADVLSRMREADALAPSQRKDGDIRAQTFGKKSSTGSFRGLLIRNQTDDVQPDYDALWEEDAPLSIDKAEPAVLIFHTHTTEGYELLDRDWYAADTTSRTTDTSRNVARVGTAIAAELERAGFRTLHDTTVHDEAYTGAYDRSRKTVEAYLRKYPNLSVVLDVHRDAIQENDGTKIKPVVTVDGKKAAQIMIISGAEGGKAVDFPNWRQNLRFALRLQDALETQAAGLTRPLFFCHRKYNMDLTPCSLLVEFGSEANTLEEAVYAGRLFGRALANLLENYVQ
jgi:stage II sporulation protein P